MAKIIRIGGASGYWGESAMATPQLLQCGDLDYLVYDYLAEITMSIMARAKAKDATRGYATDFVDSVMRDNLGAIANAGVKVISNAGGVNPEHCGKALKALIKAQGLNLSVAVITGDDRMDFIPTPPPRDIYGGHGVSAIADVASANVYIGAFPIARALSMGADIVITGRCVDSAVTLGACIHEFGWSKTDWDQLSSGSLAGHILECGPQATGGNFTDWEDVPDIDNIGYPITEVSADGAFIVTKPAGTGGRVSVGTVAEQMLYEIGDPRQYILPDVTCDFSDVSITQDGDDRVAVGPAKGGPAPNQYKTCLTYHEGFRAGNYLSVYGRNATAKAHKLADAILARTARALRAKNLPAVTEESREIMGAGSQFGDNRAADEVVLKLAVKHETAAGVGVFLKESAGMGLATPPGLSGFTGAGRARPSPIIRLLSFMTDKSDVELLIDVDGQRERFRDSLSQTDAQSGMSAHPKPAVPTADLHATVPLEALAWGRSGDKGNKANIGIIAREPDYLPFIWAALSETEITRVFAHFMDNGCAVHRYFLPGCNAMNIVLDAALGGGGAASLRNDAQAKGYAQILLRTSIPVTDAIANTVQHKQT